MIEDGCLDLRQRAVGQRLLVRQLLQRRPAARVVECLEAFKAVARVAHHLAGLAHIAELLGELPEPRLGTDDLPFRRHVR